MALLRLPYLRRTCFQVVLLGRNLSRAARILCSRIYLRGGRNLSRAFPAGVTYRPYPIDFSLKGPVDLS